MTNTKRHFTSQKLEKYILEPQVNIFKNSIRIINMRKRTGKKHSRNRHHTAGKIISYHNYPGK